MSLEMTDASAAAPANETAVAATDVGAVITDTASPAAAAASDAPIQSLDQRMNTDLRAAWDKLHPPRDDTTGRFAAKAGEKPTTETSTEQPAAEGAEKPAAEAAKPESTDQPKGPEAETATPSIAPPNSWSAEDKAEWAAVPPKAQAIIARREAEAHQAITRAGEQIKAFEPIGKVVEQFSHVFQRNNLQPHDGIARMLAVETWLGQDAKTAIGEIAKAYGVDLRELTGQSAAPSGEQQQPGTGAADPRVSTLEQKLIATETELRKVTSYLTEQQKREHMATQAKVRDETAALARQIADFASEQKDGKPLRPHFEAVRNHMGALMSADPSLTLEQAYEQASFAVPAIRNALLAEQRKAEEDKRVKDAAEKTRAAKNAAQVNVRSGPGSANSPKTMDDTLKEIARKAYA